MTVSEAAKELEITIAYTRILLYEGKLAGTKTDGIWQITPDSVAARKAARKEAQP